MYGQKGSLYYSADLMLDASKKIVVLPGKNVSQIHSLKKALSLTIDEKNMVRKYYKLWYRLDGNDSYLIWFTNDVDGVFVDSKSIIPVFYSEAGLDKYALKTKLTIASRELIVHDLDSVSQWLRRLDRVDPNCYEILDIWNMFDDVFRSLGKVFSTKSALENTIYDKLFFGNNLPAITPTDEHYEPEWSRQEITLIRQTLKLGLHQFRTSICYQE